VNLAQILSAVPEIFDAQTKDEKRELKCFPNIHRTQAAVIVNAGMKCAACGSLEMHDAKNRQTFTICAPSHNSVGPYLRKYRQSEKKFKQQYLLYMSQQYGELRPTNG